MTRLPTGSPDHQPCYATTDKERVYKEVQCVSFWVRTANDPIALYTLVLAIFTVVLAAASIWQGKLTNRSIALASAEVAATHRPKIRVRQFRSESKKISADFQVYFVCANVGGMPCDILEISYQSRKMAFDDRPILVRGEFKKVLLHPDTRLVAGELCEFNSELFRIEYLMNRDWDFAGYVRYRDDNGIVRLTGFWQRFDGLGWPTDTPENSSYAYED